MFDSCTVFVSTVCYKKDNLFQVPTKLILFLFTICLLFSAAASVTFDLYSGASSPTPSVRSNDSQSSFISHLTEKTHWAELTPEFKRRHFLVGLVLSQLSNAFDHT